MENTLDFLNPQDIRFYISDGNLLCLELKGEDLGRVAVLRAFPFEKKNEYIVVRKENYSRIDSDNEIGILRSFDLLPQNQIDILNAELDKRYFTPHITKVLNIKEEYGNIFFEAETSAGKHEFTVSDMSSNIRSIGKNTVLLTDVYGNRYLLEDVNLLDDKTMKILEIWI